MLLQLKCCPVSCHYVECHSAECHGAVFSVCATEAGEKKSVGFPISFIICFNQGILAEEGKAQFGTFDLLVPVRSVKFFL